MNNIYPSTNDEVSEIIIDAIKSNDLIIVPAWLSKNSPLVNVMTLGYNYPEYNYAPLGVSGLSGRAAPRINSTSEYDEKWISLWKSCDAVNDGYETGTFLPNVNVVMLPAFMITPPFKIDKAKKAIDDIFVAYKEYDISGNLCIFEMYDKKAGVEAIDFLNLYLTNYSDFEIKYIHQHST